MRISRVYGVFSWGFVKVLKVFQWVFEEKNGEGVILRQQFEDFVFVGGVVVVVVVVFFFGRSSFLGGHAHVSISTIVPRQHVKI